ncbi:MAG: hypothetical protein PVJ34_19860 [Anaerolineae bacterium]|jgi:hypothetical protein
MLVVRDTAARLLKMVSATPEAARVNEIGRDLLHLTPAGYEALDGALVQILASLAP